MQPSGHDAPAVTGTAIIPLTKADCANATANGATTNKGGATKVTNSYGYTATKSWTSRRDIVIHVSPMVALKLKYICLKARVEVGGFGILTTTSCQNGDGEMYINDLRMPDQENSSGFCRFTPEGIADHYVDLLEENIQPWRSRIWLHTHPGNSPQPSGVDEQTFIDSFGGANGGSLPDWAVMMIMARDGSYYARLRVNPANGPAVQQEIKVEEDWDSWPTWMDAEPGIFTSHQQAWVKEYEAKVHKTAHTYVWNGQSNPNANIRTLGYVPESRVYGGGDDKNYTTIRSTYYNNNGVYRGYHGYGFGDDGDDDAHGTARNPFVIDDDVPTEQEYCDELLAELAYDAAAALKTATNTAADLPNDERYKDVQHRIKLVRAGLQNLQQGLSIIPDA